MKTRIMDGLAGRKRTAFWFVALTFVGIWPALTNGQPFFYADTTAYVRGADLAIARAFGDRFATDWAKDQRRMIEPLTTVSNPEGLALAQPASRRVVLAGRSIVYGALLYLGEALGGMWFAVIVQSFAATYLLYLFIVRVLGLSFGHFLVCSFFVLAVSPLPFFASFLMPDVFAGFLVLAFAILATGWDRLSHVERAISGAVLLFAVLSHTTHLLLLLGLTTMTVAYVRIAARSQWANIRWLPLIAAACVTIAILWEAMFSFGVQRTFGAPPVRPPFVTAKLVSMLEPRAIAKVCSSNAFVVCSFQSRLPMDAESFLWSEDELTGVFYTADAQTKRLLSDEQPRFALAVIPGNLGHLAVGVSLDALRQLTQFHLSEFVYPSTGFFESRMPPREFARLTSTVAAHSDAYAIFGLRVVYFTAILGAIGTALLLLRLSGPGTMDDRNESEKRKTWCVAVSLLLAGIALNAIICGGIGAVNNRYQARVVWLIQLSLATGICAILADRKAPEVGNPEVHTYSAVPAFGRYEPRP